MNDELKAYLLGRLTPEQRSALEERMFADDEFFDLVSDAENDLVDDYAAGRLSPSDAASFAAFRSQLGGPRRRIAFAQAFAKSPRGRRDPNRNLRRALAFAACLAIVLLSAWFYRATKATAPVTAISKSAPNPTPNVFSILLTSSVTRESNAIRTIKVPARADVLRIAVMVPSVRSGAPLKAELFTSAGNLVWQGIPQSWEGDSPILLIPTDRLPLGPAELDLFTGSPDRRLAGVYPFQVKRE